MTPEEYYAQKAFFRDDAAESELKKSEVFAAYKQAELTRIRETQEMERIEHQKNLLAFEELERKIQASPKLRAEILRIKAHLDLHPEVLPKVDPNFVQAINLLNLED